LHKAPMEARVRADTLSFECPCCGTKLRAVAQTVSMRIERDIYPQPTAMLAASSLARPGPKPKPPAPRPARGLESSVSGGIRHPATAVARPWVGSAAALPGTPTGPPPLEPQQAGRLGHSPGTPTSSPPLEPQQAGALGVSPGTPTGPPPLEPQPSPGTPTGPPRLDLAVPAAAHPAMGLGGLPPPNTLPQGSLVRRVLPEGAVEPSSSRRRLQDGQVE
jgi:hypothetical protein